MMLFSTVVSFRQTLGQNSIYIQLALLILISGLACYATGYAFQLDEKWSTIVIATFGTPLCFLVSALFSKKLARWWFACFLILTTLYFPVGWMYGAPNFKVVGGALEADSLEIREFLEHCKALF